MSALDRSILDAVPAFAALTGKEIDIVLAQARSLRYPKGTTVCSTAISRS